MTDNPLDGTLCFMDIQLTLPSNAPKIARKTPLETKGILKVVITLEDGAELIFDTAEELMGGFYRSSELVRDGFKVLQHEVYITDGNPG